MSFNYFRYGSYVGSDAGTASKQGVHDIVTGHLLGDGATLILKVWGPGGGCGSNYSNSNSRSHGGGNGGYAEGTLFMFPIGKTIYIVVGEGGISQTGTTHPARYNGGARAGNGNYYGGSGGGATHVATATGILSSLSGDQGSVIIVAGGGAGGGNTSHAGDGGGDVGETEPNSTQVSGRTPGPGGTQTAGGAGDNLNGGIAGSFGEGGWSNHNLAGGGGSGWYGGTGGYNGTGGGGGSGYIGYTGNAGLNIPALTSTTNTQGGGSLGGIGVGGPSGNNVSTGTEGIDGKVEVWVSGALHTTFTYTGTVQSFTVG